MRLWDGMGWDWDDDEEEDERIDEVISKTLSRSSWSNGEREAREGATQVCGGYGE